LPKAAGCSNYRNDASGSGFASLCHLYAALADRGESFHPPYL